MFMIAASILISAILLSGVNIYLARKSRKPTQELIDFFYDLIEMHDIPVPSEDELQEFLDDTIVFHTDSYE